MLADGRLFASAGERDRLVRVWFPRDKGFAQLFNEYIQACHTTAHSVAERPQMDFVYLPHPRAISWLCWRKPGKTDQTFGDAR